MAREWEYKEFIGQFLVVAYTVVSLNWHQIVTISLPKFHFSLTDTVFSVGGLTAPIDGLGTIVLPIALYLVYDNDVGNFNSQTVAALIPAFTSLLVWASQPLYNLIVGDLVLTSLLFAANMTLVSIATGFTESLDVDLP